MDDDQLWNAFDDLIRVEIAVWQRVARRLATEADAPVGWHEALHVVVGRPGCRVQDVADALLITPGAASKLVDRLVAAGHLRRAPHPRDQRSQAIGATGTGRALHTRLHGALVDEMRALGRDLPAGILASLAATLSHLREAVAPRPVVPEEES